MKNYQTLIRLETFEERFNYLALDGMVGEDTFGTRRYLNQTFYSSPDWHRFRNQIIVRDMGCEMALEGHEIFESIVIHHINPLRIEDLLNGSANLMDPDNVVCVSDRIHRAIHYGSIQSILPMYILRAQNDTCPWRH